MNRTGWRWLALALMWLAVAVLLWWVARTVSLHAVWEIVSALTPERLLIWLGLNACIVLLLTMRWWLILRAQSAGVGFAPLLRHRLVLFAVSYFTPGPHVGGEPVAVYLLRREHGVPGSVSMASLAIDRALDLLLNFAFIGAGVWLIAQRGFGGRLNLTGVTVSLVVVALLLVFLVAFWAGERPLTALSYLLQRLAPQRPILSRAVQAVRHTEDEIARFLRVHTGVALSVLVLSAFIWLLLIAEFWLTLSFLGLPLPLPDLIIVMVAARIAYLLPSPAALGTLEGSQTLIFTVMGLNPAIAISMALLIRMRDVALGLIGLALGGWSVSFGMTALRPALKPYSVDIESDK